jgi:hypothetical protein
VWQRFNDPLTAQRVAYEFRTWAKESDTVVRSLFHLQTSKGSKSDRITVLVEQRSHVKYTTDNISGQHATFGQCCFEVDIAGVTVSYTSIVCQVWTETFVEEGICQCRWYQTSVLCWVLLDEVFGHQLLSLVWIGNDLEGRCRDLIEILFRHLLGETEEYLEKPQDSIYPGQNLDGTASGGNALHSYSGLARFESQLFSPSW